MAPSLADLMVSPDHYLHSFDGGEALFVPMDRAAYRRSIFLDARISPAAGGTLRVPLASLAPLAGRPAATGWIFHVAHCGSTLLARALGELSDNLVLREPLALRQQALAPGEGSLKLVLAMLAKRYAADRPTVVKANVPVNFLLGPIAAADPQARAILLHCPLRDYLLAILRSDRHRGWIRTLTTQLAPHLGEVAGLADAERAAALWLAQMRRFAAALEAMPNARSLDAEVFFANPRTALAATAGRLQVAASGAVLDSLVGGPLFATYSKNPGVAFDNQARLARRAALAAPLAAEIDIATCWLERTAPDAGETLAVIAAGALDLAA